MLVFKIHKSVPGQAVLIYPMRSIILLTVFIALLSLISFLKAADVESGFLFNNDDPFLDYYSSSSSSSEEIINAPRPRARNSTIKQYYSAYFIFILIPEVLSAASFLNEEIELLIVAAIYWIVFVASLHVYSGYFWVWDSSSHALSLKPIRFSGTGRNGTYGQWIITPLSWINEIIIFQSNENYQLLQNDYCLPDRYLLIIVLIIQILYFSGILHQLLIINIRTVRRNQ